jgi:predicted nucleic-acid-binding Zn-ribbon protein
MATTTFINTTITNTIAAHQCPKCNSVNTQIIGTPTNTSSSYIICLNCGYSEMWQAAGTQLQPSVDPSA